VVLDGGMSVGMSVAIHSNNKCFDLHYCFMPCIARWYLRLRTTSYLYWALNFCYFFFKKKVREKWCKSKIIKELKAGLKI